MRAERTKAVKAHARALGFDRVGVASAAPADPDDRLSTWLDRGFDADMGYMARTAAERADPSRIVPGARSVIALAMSYYWPEDGAPAGPRVARYARGDDYHKVIRKKIRKLRKQILAMAPDAKVHPAVDTSPVLEREWAQRAGVAWIGKSTMAIAPDLGTYTFLATLITDLDLEADAPHPDRCGTCTACLDACPTAAFAGPHQLDARRCVTYWTVEHRGPFIEQTPPLHGWLAGCDRCQEVCPWNKFARPTREPRLRPRPELADPDLLAFAHDADHVARSIAGTTLQRTGVESMQRNAVTALEDPRARATRCEEDV